MKIRTTLLLSFFCISNLFAGDAFNLQPVEGEPPVKLYIMAGQSNFGWKIRVDGMKKYAPEVLAWLASAENDVLYSWKQNKIGKGSTSNGFIKLDKTVGMHAPNLYAPDHILAYHLSKHWKQQNPKQRIAIIKVQQGATSLVQHWNPGSQRGKGFYKEGDMHVTLIEQIESGIAELDKAGIAWEGAGFFWYQGEGDCYDAGASYARLFDDLVYGAEFDSDQGVHKIKGVLPLIKNINAPVIPVRISWHIHTVTREGAPAPGMWGKRPREAWEPHLVQVRDALTQFAEKHNGRKNAIVDVDDLPLSDRFHYDQKEYVEIGHRMAKAFLP